MSRFPGSYFFSLTCSTFRHVLTGSYHNYFRIFDVESLSDVVLQADKSAFKAKKIGGPLPGNKLGAKNGARGLRDAMQMETLDFNKKILHASWHPRENTIAVRFLSSFQCDRIVDIHRARLDRCNEQLVLIQRRMKFGVVLGSVVALLPLVAPPSFRRVVVCLFLPFFNTILGHCHLASRRRVTLYIAAIAHCPSPVRSSSSPRFLHPSYLNVAHTSLLDRHPRELLVLKPSTSLTPSPSSLPILTHAHPHFPVQSLLVDQTRS